MSQEDTADVHVKGKALVQRGGGRDGANGGVRV